MDLNIARSNVFKKMYCKTGPKKVKIRSYLHNSGSDFMGKKAKLMIVDDNEELLSALASFFRSKDYEVQAARNGLDAIKLLENETEKFDLVITDLIMPHISGVWLISIIKKKNPDLQIIAITGWGMHPESLAEEASADRVLKKPFQLVEIEQVAKELIGERSK